jgi:hypothetical protein
MQESLKIKFKKGKSCSTINTGVLIAPPKTTDFMFGGETGIIAENRIDSGNWNPFVLLDEWQATPYFDTMACVSFSALNCVEAQANYLLQMGKISAENKLKLKQWGFLDEFDRFNFSDRFTAYMSGTTKQGNYMHKVWDSIRKDGLLPENDWTYEMRSHDSKFNWDDYYKDPGQERKDKAKKILEILDIKYEWVTSGASEMNQTIRDVMASNLKQAPLHIASATCWPWNTTEIIKNCGSKVTTHATMIYNIEQINKWFDCYDHYIPFRKRLAWDYIIPYIIKGVVTPKESVPTPIDPNNPPSFKHKFEKPLYFGMRNSPEVQKLQKALKIDGCFPINVFETGNYLNITRLAVEKFQKKYKVAGWYELFIVKGQNVGPKTMAQLNKLFNN